ncbi:uncharacterized protein [Clytia hemisphaerica]|uniref:Uncharacterized protein n=1 Tax=Clytia hemisphaerica TaxID=252671 RepID=A0A7M5UP33_9CNID
MSTTTSNPYYNQRKMTRHELLKSNVEHRHHNHPTKKTNTFVPPKDALIEENCVGDFNNEYNIVIIGDRGVGKSSILFKHTTDMYSQTYLPTIGVDFRRSVIKSRDNDINATLKLWDTPGTIPEIKPTSKDLFRSASAFLCIYDVTNIESYNNMYHWMNLIRKYSLDQSQLVVIGNKTDLTNERRLSKEDGMRLAASYGAKFMETNVPQKRNIQKLFERLAVNLSK